MKRFGILCLGSALLAGCAADNRNGGARLVNKDTADELSAEHSNFDGPEPTITAQTRFAAGQLAETQNSPARAIEQYKAALKIDPKHAPSMYRLAVVYTMAKEYPQAIKVWQDYIKLTNESANAYGNLGFCYELAERYDEAEATYLKGIDKDPNNASCRTNYGLMLARHDKIEQARQQLGAVLKPAEVHYNLGSVYELRGLKAKARDEYQSALKIDKDMKDAEKRLAALN